MVQLLLSGWPEIYGTYESVQTRNHEPFLCPHLFLGPER